jgi:hypothetical protein
VRTQKYFTRVVNHHHVEGEVALPYKGIAERFDIHLLKVDRSGTVGKMHARALIQKVSFPEH